MLPFTSVYKLNLDVTFIYFIHIIGNKLAHLVLIMCNDCSIITLFTHLCSEEGIAKFSWPPQLQNLMHKFLKLVQSQHYMKEEGNRCKQAYYLSIIQHKSLDILCRLEVITL